MESGQAAFSRCAYHCDVIWVPAGEVLMSEQAYTLLSGATRTGLMTSWEHPAQNSVLPLLPLSCPTDGPPCQLTLEDGDKTKVLIRRPINVVGTATGKIDTVAHAVRAGTQGQEPEEQPHVLETCVIHYVLLSSTGDLSAAKVSLLQHVDSDDTARLLVFIYPSQIQIRGPGEEDSGGCPPYIDEYVRPSSQRKAACSISSGVPSRHRIGCQWGKCVGLVRLRGRGAEIITGRAKGQATRQRWWPPNESASPCSWLL